MAERKKIFLKAQINPLYKINNKHNGKCHSKTTTTTHRSSWRCPLCSARSSPRPSRCCRRSPRPGGRRRSRECPGTARSGPTKGWQMMSKSIFFKKKMALCYCKSRAISRFTAMHAWSIGYLSQRRHRRNSKIAKSSLKNVFCFVIFKYTSTH